MYASKSLQADTTIVYAAVTQNGHALRFASKGLQADAKTVLAAVGQDGLAFQFAAAALRSDPAVVRQAASRNGGVALRYAADELRSSAEIVLEMVKGDGRGLKHAADALRSDPVIARAAVEQSGCVRVPSRSIPPPWGSIRFRLAPRTYAPRGPSVRVVPDRLTKSRKIPTRKLLPLFFLSRPCSLLAAPFGLVR